MRLKIIRYIDENILAKKILQAFLGIIGLPSIFLELIKREGRWRYACLQYKHVFFDKGSYTDNHCHFGSNVKIYSGTLIANSTIDSYSYIGINCTIKNSSLGKFCAVGPEVRIGLGNHPVHGVISTYPGFYSANASGATSLNIDSSVQEYQPISIGNDVWIGARALILDGVSIGDGAIIAAGSVVTKSVQPYTIVGGVPAKIIKERFSTKEIETLLNFSWWEKDIEQIKKISKVILNEKKFFKEIV